MVCKDSSRRTISKWYVLFSSTPSTSTQYDGTKYALSMGSLTVSHASQSDLVVLRTTLVMVILAVRMNTHGNNPIPLTFQIPSANAKQLHPTNAAFAIIICPLFPSVSNRENVF